MLALTGNTWKKVFLLAVSRRSRNVLLTRRTRTRLGSEKESERGSGSSLARPLHSTHSVFLRSQFDESRPASEGGLRGLMYKNVDTLHRIRHTHSNLAILTNPSYDGGPLPILAPINMEPRRLSIKARARRRAIPLEGGAHLAENVILDCTQDVLEHAGFEGRFALISVLFCVNAISTQGRAELP